MYIFRIVPVKSEEEYVSVYTPENNSIVKVSKDVYELLVKLHEKYRNEKIDAEDEILTRLKSKNGYESLLKYRILNPNKYEITERYNAFKGKLAEVYLHVTQECNLRCTYCYAQNNLGKNMKMKFREAKKYIDILYAEGARKFNITGGEALINEDTPEIINYIKSLKGTMVCLLSNGTLFSKNIDVLRVCDSIIMSLDVNGAPNRKGLNYDKLVKDITGLDEVLKKKITIRSVISKGEEKYVEPMKKMANEWGMDYIFVPRLPNSPEEVNDIPNLKTVKFNDEYVDSMKMIKCGATTSELAIDWNGDVYPCQTLMKTEHNITNLNREDWKEVLESSKLTHEIRTAHVNNIEKCSSCDYKYMCGGGCRALSYNVYGEYNHCLEFFCESFMQTAIEKLKKVTFREGEMEHAV